MARRELTERQKLFCKEYIVDWNGQEAAKRAGYSETHASSYSSRLLRNGAVQAEIDVLLGHVTERTEITVDLIRSELWLNHKLAQQKGDLSNSTKALELLGKNAKMFTDRIETLDRNAMTDEEIEAELALLEANLDQRQKAPSVGTDEGTREAKPAALN